jgi:hypothetical protein
LFRLNDLFGASHVLKFHIECPHLFSFVTSKHIHTHWGTAFTAAATDDNQEALLTAFELIRFDILTSNEYSKTYEKGPKGKAVISSWRHIFCFKHGALGLSIY